MYENYYDKLQPYFGRRNLHIHYLDNDSLVFSVNTKCIIEDLKNPNVMSDFSNLSEILELFSNKNLKKIGKLKVETPKKSGTFEFVCLRSKMYAIKCGNDSKKNEGCF